MQDFGHQCDYRRLPATCQAFAITQGPELLRYVTAFFAVIARSAANGAASQPSFGVLSAAFPRPAGSPVTKSQDRPGLWSGVPSRSRGSCLPKTARKRHNARRASPALLTVFASPLQSPSLRFSRVCQQGFQFGDLSRQVGLLLHDVR
jgi:hypothetical protein